MPVLVPVVSSQFCLFVCGRVCLRYTILVSAHAMRPWQGGWEPEEEEEAGDITSGTELEREINRVQRREVALQEQMVCGNAGLVRVQMSSGHANPCHFVSPNLASF